MSSTSDLAKKYRGYLDNKIPMELDPALGTPPSLRKVGIVGAGMAGLYSALLLKNICTWHFCENI